MTPFIAEIIGTFLLLLLGCGVVANVILQGTKGQNSGWIVITTGWAIAVFIAVFVSGPYSGAHINPAVTIGLAVAGEFPWADVPTYLLAQMIGAMLGAFFTFLAYRDHFNATEDQGIQLATFSTHPAKRNYAWNLITEAIGTFVLVFAVLYLTDASMVESGQVIGLGSLGALPVAMVVWGIGLSLGGPTGYAINPARDLGPRIMHAILPIKNKGGSDWGYSWVPVLGPIVGGVIAAALDMILKMG
ncbi:MAG: aquaporin family protein [Eudoraea sp.]|nr:aquaporin family protein [Eudoraea sp.]